VTVINPLSSFALQKYEKLSTSLSNKDKATIFVTKSKLFFREYIDNEHHFIAAKSVNIKKNKIYNVNLVTTDANYKFLFRADAEEASLENNLIILHHPIISYENKTEKLPILSFATKISLNKLALSIKSPEKINIWQLPTIIEYSSKSGLPVIKYQLHYYKELTKPFAMVAMSQIAYIFLRLNNRQSKTYPIIKSIVLSVFIYGILEFSFRILAYNGVIPILAIIMPLIFIILIINFAILHFQEA
jgi:lipopolysaccharide export LptBFGC system permease protein LptF